MTFTEAAVEVLRLVGKPLHFKRITDIAIERNLLSHVGKTPEVTMSSRLATLVKGDRGDSPIIKVKPGVFGLREFSKEVLAAAESESGHDYELPEEEEVSATEPDANEANPESPVDPVEAAKSDEAKATGDETAQASEAGAAVEVPKVKPKRATGPALPGGEVFPEEDDDDEPILANLDDEEADDDSRGGRGRRRRRRRKRGGEEGAEVEATAAPVEAPERQERPARPERHERPDNRERNDRARGDRDRGDRDRGRNEERGGFVARESREEIKGDWQREPDDGELTGKDLADSVFSVLQAGDRNPTPWIQVTEVLVRRGRLTGDPAMLGPTVAAALRADTARRESENMRPRFRIEPGRVSLTDWLLPREALRFEQEAVRSADRQRDQVRRGFLRKLAELPVAGLVELFATWLNAEGVQALRGVRRPGGSPNTELHFAGTLRRANDEQRLAIILLRDGRDVGREKVVEARGALAHYSGATSAWVITLGQVLGGAREEAALVGAPPVALFDGFGLARAMERAGVGLRRHIVRLSTMDFDLLDMLRGNAPQSREPREGRDGQREGRDAPREGRDAPREGRDAPREGREGQREGRDAPREGREGQREGRDAPREGREGQREGREGQREGREGRDRYRDRRDRPERGERQPAGASPTMAPPPPEYPKSALDAAADASEELDDVELLDVTEETSEGNATESTEVGSEAAPETVRRDSGIARVDRDPERPSFVDIKPEGLEPERSPTPSDDGSEDSGA